MIRALSVCAALGLSVSVGVAQPKLTSQGEQQNNNNVVEVLAEAFFPPPLEDNIPASSFSTPVATATDITSGATASGTAEILGSSRVGAGPANINAAVKAEGRYTTQGTATLSSAVAKSVSASAHRWHNALFEKDPNDLDPNKVYVLRGTYSVSTSGDGHKWAGVAIALQNMAPFISVNCDTTVGITGQVMTVAEENGQTVVRTETINEPNVFNKTGSISFVVSDGDVLKFAAGGSAGLPGEFTAFPGQNFNFSGSGKAEIEITDVVEMYGPVVHVHQNGGGGGGGGDGPGDGDY